MDQSLRQIRKLITEQRLAVLSTRQGDGQPYASLVAVVASEDLRKVGFATLRSTRKFDNLQAESRVALLIDDRANAPSDLLEAATLTMLGRTRELKGPEREGWAAALIARHAAMDGFVRAPQCAVLVVEVSRILLVTQFQNVVEFAWNDGELARVASASS